MAGSWTEEVHSTPPQGLTEHGSVTHTSVPQVQVASNVQNAASVNGINKISRVCVFAGSRDGLQTIYVEETRKLAVLLANEKWNLIYGAGTKG